MRKKREFIDGTGAWRQSNFFLREYFFPFGCSICGAVLVKAGETWYGLCDECRAGIERDLAENRQSECCGLCGKPLISEHRRCLSCRKDDAQNRAYDRVSVLFPYTGKYRRLLAAYKFSKNLALGNFFAEKIAQTLDLTGISPETHIVPVPPRPGKIRESGWDQVEYMARLLKKSNSGLPVNRCLKRLPSQSQKKLGRDSRQTNLKGRIVTVREPPKRAVIIDDVMTTGATLDACATALKEGGAEAVYGLCLFYD